jgi:hypothetical protein
MFYMRTLLETLYDQMMQAMVEEGFILKSENRNLSSHFSFGDCLVKVFVNRLSGEVIVSIPRTMEQIYESMPDELRHFFSPETASSVRLTLHEDKGEYPKPAHVASFIANACTLSFPLAA